VSYYTRTRVTKFNPYHGKDGRFTDKAGAKGNSLAPGVDKGLQMERSDVPYTPERHVRSKLRALQNKYYTNRLGLDRVDEPKDSFLDEIAAKAKASRDRLKRGPRSRDVYSQVNRTLDLAV